MGASDIVQVFVFRVRCWKTTRVKVAELKGVCLNVYVWLLIGGFCQYKTQLGGDSLLDFMLMGCKGGLLVTSEDPKICSNFSNCELIKPDMGTILLKYEKNI